MKRLLFLILIIFLFFNASAQKITDYLGEGLPGISNKGLHKDKPYVAAGTRCYLIGTQDGMFPDMGEHIKGEMGGLWCPPFKLADGFWAMIQDEKSSEWLTGAKRFTNYPYGNKFEYQTGINGITIERFQFSPDGVTGTLVRFTIKNTSGSKKNLKFIFSIKSNLRPVWFTDTVDRDYPDMILSTKSDPFIVAKDSLKSWYLAVVSSLKPGKHLTDSLSMAEQTTGKGVTDALEYSIAVKGNSSATITFAIGGGDTDQEATLKTCNYLLENYNALLQAKKKHYADILNTSKITIPDAHLQNVYNWVKINTESLTREVPGIGKGLSAGYMEYPWWFGCDNTYALQGVLATGNFKLAKQTLDLLYRKSKEANGNGRIAHEISTSGKVYNKGNTQETAHFIMCAGTYLKWTGDTAFVHQLYPYIKLGIYWLLNTMDTNKNMFPEGYGIMEVTGLNAELIDVSVYTEQALEAATEMARIFKDDKAEGLYRSLALKLKGKINTDFWDNDNNSYCDFYGSKQQALSTIKGSIKQLELNVKQIHDADHQAKEDYYRAQLQKIGSIPDGDRGWLTNKNWVINTPMETGIAPREKAIVALNKIRNEDCGPYGPYLSAVEKIYMMTIATGVQAVAECRYGRIDQGMWYVNKISSTFNRVLPGSISEMMPDYGCFTQAWTNYGIDIPLICYVFGIQPDAVHKTVNISPDIPSKWNNLNIQNVIVGNDQLSINIKRNSKEITYTIEQNSPAWHIKFNIARNYNKCVVNGKFISPTNNSLVLSGKTNTITLSGIN